MRKPFFILFLMLTNILATSFKQAEPNKRIILKGSYMEERARSATTPIEAFLSSENQVVITTIKPIIDQVNIIIEQDGYELINIANITLKEQGFILDLSSLNEGSYILKIETSKSTNLFGDFYIVNI